MFIIRILGEHNATRSEVEVYIKFSRQSLYHVTQSFFQSWLLGFLAYLTFWIDMEDFNDRFIGALTALLVLASLMTNMTENLPNTSYFKVIDIWLLFFLITNAAVIAVHIIVDLLLRSERKTLSNVRHIKSAGYFNARQQVQVYYDGYLFYLVGRKEKNPLFDERKFVVKAHKGFNFVPNWEWIFKSMNSISE